MTSASPPAATVSSESSPIVLHLFRWTAVAEGISYIVLLAIAMPLKYVWGEPGAVRVVGMAHGLLFLAYLVLLAQCALTLRWSVIKTLKFFIASSIPLAAIWVDRELRRERAHASAVPSPASTF